MSLQLSKKEKKKLIRKLQKKFDYTHIHYTFDNDTASLSGYYPFLANFMKLLSIKDILAEHVQLDRKGRLYSNMDMFYTLVDSLIFDRERTENLGLLNHTLCQKIRELKNIPDAQTARDYLETFNPENVHELFRANKEILSRVQDIVGPQEVTLLSDTHVTTVYGQQERVEVGYNPKKHGRPSFQSKVAFLHNNGWLINFQLCGGKSTSKTDFQSFFEQTESLLPKGCWLSRVRLDRGFFSEETCLFLEAKETLTYYLKGVVNPAMHSHFAQIPEEDFTKELSYEFYIDKVNSQEFTANYAFMAM